MTNSDTIASIADLKLQAKRLRAGLKDTGTTISYGEALELIANQYGARDWNTLHARTTNRPASPKVGERVTGHYLGQRFAGVVRGMTKIGQDDQYRITLHFDDPVDVVRFDSFSSFRQRVSTLINAEGICPRKTSDGVPQLIVDRSEV
jgi:Glyoxalase superfamily protein